MRPGMMMEMYWSAVRMLLPRQVASVAVINPAAPFTAASKPSISFASKPAYSMTAPNVMAQRISQTVLSMDAMPPPDSRSLSAASPVSTVMPA